MAPAGHQHQEPFKIREPARNQFQNPPVDGTPEQRGHRRHSRRALLVLLMPAPIPENRDVLLGQIRTTPKGNTTVWSRTVYRKLGTHCGHEIEDALRPSRNGPPQRRAVDLPSVLTCGPQNSLKRVSTPRIDPQLGSDFSAQA